MAFRNPVRSLPASGIIGQIPGTQIDGPLNPGTVTGPAIAPGGVQLPHLENAIMAALSQKWWDFGDSAAKWARQGTPQITSVSLPDASGGMAMRVVGYSIQWRPDVLIPFDPAALYRVSATVRQTVAGSNTANQRVYIGAAGFAADRTTFVNINGLNLSGSQAFAAARGVNLTAGGGWQTFTGYIKGHAATTGDGGPNPSLLAPMAVHPNVRFLSPLMFLNYTGGDGTVEVDTVTIEVVSAGPVDGATQIVPGTIIADRFAADAFDGKTMTAVTMNTAVLNGATVNGINVTGTSTVTGATVQTSAAGNRVAMDSGTGAGGGAVGRVRFFTEVTNDSPGSVIGLGPVDGGQRGIVVTAPKSALNPNPAAALALSYDPETSQPTAQLPALTATSLKSFGKLDVIGQATIEDLAVTNTFSAVADRIVGGATAATGWTVNNFEVRACGPMVMVRAVATRTGATITANSAGNITDSLVLTLPAGWEPDIPIAGSYDRASVADGCVVIGTDGTVTLKSLSPTATIDTTGQIQFAVSWITVF
jgi:hypothetical protein